MNTQRAGGRPRARIGIIGVFVFLLLLLLGSIVALVVGLEKQQEAASLAVAPVCTSGRVADCKLNEKVTVVDLYTVTPGRGPSVRYVKVQTPDGSVDEVGENAASDLYDLLSIGDEVNAELWNGTVIQLDDGDGHSLTAEDSPTVAGPIALLLGAGGIIVSCYLLFAYVRGLRRANRRV